MPRPLPSPLESLRPVQEVRLPNIGDPSTPMYRNL